MLLEHPLLLGLMARWNAEVNQLTAVTCEGCRVQDLHQASPPHDFVSRTKLAALRMLYPHAGFAAHASATSLMSADSPCVAAAALLTLACCCAAVSSWATTWKYCSSLISGRLTTRGHLAAMGSERLTLLVEVTPMYSRQLLGQPLPPAEHQGAAKHQSRTVRRMVYGS
jgi:hypothetical protein